MNFDVGRSVSDLIYKSCGPIFDQSWLCDRKLKRAAAAAVCVLEMSNNLGSNGAWMKKGKAIKIGLCH